MWSAAGSGNGVRTATATPPAATTTTTTAQVACGVVAAAAAAAAAASVVAVAATLILTAGVSSPFEGERSVALAGDGRGRADGRKVNVLLVGEGFSHQPEEEEEEECHMCKFHHHKEGGGGRSNFSGNFDAAVWLGGVPPLPKGGGTRLSGRLIANPEELLKSNNQEEEEEEEEFFDFSISYFPEASVKIFEGHFRRKKKEEVGERTSGRSRRRSASPSPSRVVATVVDRCQTPSNREGFIQEVEFFMSGGASLQKTITQPILVSLEKKKKTKNNGYANSGVEFGLLYRT